MFPDKAGFNPNPIAVFGGETWAEEGLIGRALDAGYGTGGGVLAIGGYEGNTNGLDNGSVYVLTFSD